MEYFNIFNNYFRRLWAWNYYQDLRSWRNDFGFSRDCRWTRGMVWIPPMSLQCYRRREWGLLQSKLAQIGWWLNAFQKRRWIWDYSVGSSTRTHLHKMRSPMALVRRRITAILPNLLWHCYCVIYNSVNIIQNSVTIPIQSENWSINYNIFDLLDFQL